MEEALLRQTRKLIASRIGVLVREHDDATLRRVIAERVRALNLSGAEQYCRLLREDADIRREREELTLPLTTGETYFFRDSGQHALLKERILPELLERRKAERTLRIWCAACSSGEEAYSIAILLDELMGDQSQWNISIIGTDINHRAIGKAQQGIYSEWSFRGTSDERKHRYFHRHKEAWELDERIRGRVTFQPGDLVADSYPDHASGLDGMDLILCRNMFIYMAPEAVFSIADKFTETLTDGGILITGHSELYSHHLGKLRARVFPESIVYQKVAGPFISPPTEPVVRAQRPARKKTTALFSGVRGVRTTPPQQAAVESDAGKEVPDMLHIWNYANQGQREMAEKSCREIIAGNPLAAEPHYLMAVLAEERGEFAEAKLLLKKVIYLDHAFIAAYLDLGDLYAREGERERAAKMRLTAHDLLKKLPGDERVKLYGPSTVNDVLQYIEKLLGSDNQNEWELIGFLA